MIDSQLMERYVGGHDSQAFHDLVTRHSPGVLRVCRRFVVDPHAAEDAMQATFLILVQRAPSIRHPEQLDRWLAGVARKVAARARRREIRRADREQKWAETRPEASTDGEKPLYTEMRRVVREELGCLADADRQPLTMCYLDGLTHEEAARRIGCPVGTIKARLVRARRRLRERLDRRGVALSLGLLLLLLRRPQVATAHELSQAATTEVMTWAAAGDLDSVRACYPQGWELAQTTTALAGMIERRAWISLALALMLAALSGVTLVAHAEANQQARRATAQLVKLLDMNCQEKR